jgi:F5/8 type C domain
MAGVYSLAVNATLTVPTRRPDLNGAVVVGNLAQCKPVIDSNSTVFPGQLPLAAVDSSNGTAWQPSTSAPSYLVVDLLSQQQISGVHINWGDTPAVSFEVNVGNDSSTFNVSFGSVEVQISAPYNETQENLVDVFLGNVTSCPFNAVGRYI